MLNLPVYKFALSDYLISVCEGKEFKPDDFLPKRADSESSGWDVRCAIPEGLNLRPGCYYKIPLGFRAFCPQGWWAELNPRSSTFVKLHCHSLYGKIDETFPLEWNFLCQYIPDACKIQNSNNPFRIEFGDRIGQIIPVKRQEMLVEPVSNEEMDLLINNRAAERVGGLGSSGQT